MKDGDEARDGSQYLLSASGLVSLDALPWGGKAPRVLTKGFRAVFSGQRGQEHERFFKDPNQIDMFGDDLKGRAIARSFVFDGLPKRGRRYGS